MTAITTPTVIFLFEDEVRQAARQLATLRAMRSATTEHSDDEIEQAICDAINVCMAALAGAEQDDACVMLARKPDLGLAPSVAINLPPT
jgi:uncharacterized protein (UPF0371 family)